jgi:hypothetical protein
MIGNYFTRKEKGFWIKLAVCFLIVRVIIEILENQNLLSPSWASVLKVILLLYSGGSIFFHFFPIFVWRSAKKMLQLVPLQSEGKELIIQRFIVPGVRYLPWFIIGVMMSSSAAQNIRHHKKRIGISGWLHLRKWNISRITGTRKVNIRFTAMTAYP